MPHSYIEAETPPSSSSSANCSSSPPAKGAELSQSQQFPPSSSSRRRNTEEAEDFSLDETEPFPDDLFRIPVRDALFREIPELSDVALRSLLALIHLSHRYDPAEESWIHTEKWLSRSELEEAAGISSQGARDGLEELEASGWARADREGRSYSYQLLLEVPDRRYTYLPTELLERVDGLGSAELRVLLVVLRGTWGWTETKQEPEGGYETVHARWTEASTQTLADATGRSESAIKRAIKALEGEWIERVRPGHGTYHYRFLPEVVSESSRGNSSSSEDTSKNLTPHRQNSDPPSSYKESLSRDKHSQSRRKKSQRKAQSRKPSRKVLCPRKTLPSENKPTPRDQPNPNRPTRETQNLTSATSRPKNENSHGSSPMWGFGQDELPKSYPATPKSGSGQTSSSTDSELLNRLSAVRELGCIKPSPKDMLFPMREVEPGIPLRVVPAQLPSTKKSFPRKRRKLTSTEASPKNASTVASPARKGQTTCISPSRTT